MCLSVCLCVAVPDLCALTCVCCGQCRWPLGPQHLVTVTLHGGRLCVCMCVRALATLPYCAVCVCVGGAGTGKDLLLLPALLQHCLPCARLQPTLQFPTKKATLRVRQQTGLRLPRAAEPSPRIRSSCFGGCACCVCCACSLACCLASIYTVQLVHVCLFVYCATLHTSQWQPRTVICLMLCITRLPHAELCHVTTGTPCACRRA